MATQNVNIGINISDNGSAKKVIKDVNSLHSSIKATQASAEKLSAPKAAGFRGAAAATGTDAQLSNQEYNRGRGSMGATGASARDFANQAQGLGGLVRLYATYAANIFAVGAAFRALSGAMDTANLVKGLDQLGAASGTALGTLSKRLVESTDGAISLREAMEATAKASSSGMSSENILRMGKVAKQASQALGVDMADAVNRLTRGITKLEPELLDEIGIFTKVDMATQAYAKSIGKSTSAITDFEKRMAFANAVLAEGEKKFSAIDFETNPYTKLLATLKDVSQVGLELVNTVFAPIVKFLSENPKALGLAIAALGAALVKQALPALGQFKAGLSAAAAEATALAKSRSDEALRAEKQLNALIMRERETFADKEIQKLNIASEQLTQAGIKKSASAMKLLTSSDFTAVDADNIKSIEAQIKRVNVEADKYAKQAERAAKAGKSTEVVDSLNQKAEAYRNAAYAAESSLKAEIAYAQSSQNASKGNYMATLLAERAEKSRIASVKQAIVTNAAYNASLIGPVGALKLMSVELAKSGLQLGIFGKGMLYARAGLAAFTGAVTTVLSSLGSILNAFAIVGASVAFLTSMFSKNQKQMGEFNSALDATEASVSNLTRTLDAIDKKPFGEQFNTQSLLATATAIGEISDSVSALVKNLSRVEEASSGFDRLVDLVKSAWGGDVKTKFAENLANTIFDSFEELEGSADAKQAKEAIAALLNVSPGAGREVWMQATEGIVDNKVALKQLVSEYEAFKLRTGQAADNAQQFDLAMGKSKDALKSFTDQFKVKDELSLFAETLLDSSEKTAIAFQKPEDAIARLASVINDPKQFELFGAEDQKNLMVYGNEVTRINKSYEEQRKRVRDTSEELQQLQKQYDEMRKGVVVSDDVQAATDPIFEKAKKDLDAKKAQLQNQQAAVARTYTQVQDLAAKFPSIAANQLARGAELLGISITASFAKANTAFADAVLGSVGDLPGLAKERAAMEMRKLQSEATLLGVQQQMLRATLQNTVALQKRSAEEAVSIAQSDVKETGTEEARKRLQAAQRDLQNITEKENILNLDVTKAIKGINAVKDAAKSGNTEVAKSATEMMNYFSASSGIALQKLNNLDAQAAVNFKEKLGLISEEYSEIGKIVAAQQQLNALNISDLAITKAKNGGLAETEISAEKFLKIEAANLEAATKNLAISKEIASLQLAKGTGKVSATEVDRRVEALQAQITNNVLKARQEIDKANIDSIKEIISLKQKEFDQEQKLDQIRRSGSDALGAAGNKVLNIENSAAKQAETFSPDYQAQRDAEISGINVQYQTEIDLINLRDEYKRQSFALDQEIRALQATANTEEGARNLAALQAQQTALGQAYEQRKSAINSVTAAELESIAKIEAARKETEGFDNLINSIQSLEGAFEGMGSGLSSTVKAFGDASKAQKQYSANIEDLGKKLGETKEGTAEYAALEKDISVQRNKQTKDEISGYGKIAGSAKTLFKEKSTGYKVLAAVEKVMHITRLAMDAAEMVSDTTKTGVAVANSATRTGATVIEAGVDAVAGIIKAIASMPFPINIIAGVATAAVMAGLLSQIGGKSAGVGGAAAGGVSAEDRQETQGTGMSWVDGKKVENGGGVFGDPTQKLDSINKGIQTLKDNSIDGLFYDNRMLKALEAMAQSMTGVATALFAIPGINSGLNFGTMSGSSSKSGIPIISKLFGGSSKTSKEIEDVGIQLRGNLESLIASQYKDIVTTTTRDGGLFFSDSTKTSRSRETQALGNDINAAFIDIFKGAKTLFTEIGSLAGISSQKVIDAFRFTSVNLDVSLKGLTGTEALEELNAVISSQLDKVARSLFSGFDKFRKFGEGFTDTVIRVVDGNMKVTTAVSAMGLSINKLSGNFDASERIINNMSGSLANFNDQAKFFIDNFLTDVERIAIVQKGVTQALTDMGLYTELTREEFKKLVQMQDLTTETGRMMYQNLMDIQEGFFTLTERLEDMKAESRSLQIELLKAQGRTKEANAAIDALATQGMTRVELATYNYNKALKAQLDAIKEAEAVQAQKVALEQKLLQVAGDTVALRTIELSKLDKSNHALQVAVWYLEYYTKAVSDASANIEKATQLIAQNESTIESIRNRATDAYVAATDKVAAAQTSIANLAIEAARKMQTLGKTLREFVTQQLGGKTTSNNASKAFSDNIKVALTGDTSAMEKVPELAQAAIDAARSRAGSSQQFSQQRASILSEVNKVASLAESRAALTNIPAEADPLVEANRNLENAIKEQTKALKTVNDIGAALVKTPEDLLALYKTANTELAAAIVRKTELEIARAKAQKALDDIVGNTGNLIQAINGSSDEVKSLAKLLEKDLVGGLGNLDQNLDGKLTFDELQRGLKGKASDSQIKELMDLVDLNSDAVVDGYELELFNSTQSIVSALNTGFNKLDTNLDGKVSEAEFIKGMSGKASDQVLKSIFDLVDADNDKIITATELTAAKSVISADNSVVLPDIDEGLAVNALITATGADETIAAVVDLNNANLLTITNNTAVTVQALERLLKNNVELFNAMNSVAQSTAALANAVKSGSGGGTASSSGSSAFLGIFGKTIDAIGNVVDKTVSVVSSVVSGAVNVASKVVNTVVNVVKDVVVNPVKKFFKKVFSDERTKTDISLYSRLSNGISLYDFKYKAPYSDIYGTDRKRGVIAQEVMGQYPSAVSKNEDGMYMVDYSKLPIPTDMLKFATGGVFSNSVITRPTGFELGLMGEAGPEAVMPLSRTRSGQLGVVAQTAPGDSNAREMLKQNAALINEVKNLREEVSLLRYEARATATATTKTTRLLERVTQNGDSLLVTDTATV